MPKKYADIYKTDKTAAETLAVFHLMSKNGWSYEQSKNWANENGYKNLAGNPFSYVNAYSLINGTFSGIDWECQEMQDAIAEVSKRHQFENLNETKSQVIEAVAKSVGVPVETVEVTPDPEDLNGIPRTRNNPSAGEIAHLIIQAGCVNTAMELSQSLPGHNPSAILDFMIQVEKRITATFINHFCKGGK